MVDIKASRLPALAGQGEETFNNALLTYGLCILAGVVLVVLGTLFLFLVLMNAAYKVIQKYPIIVDITHGNVRGATIE